MEILIKSYNRAYYLDRCLRSIYQHVKGEFTVKVLDDGTPSEYLAQITKLYPQVHLYHSPQYAAKVQAIEDNITQGKPIPLTKIPVGFWVQEVRNSSDYFLLIEDDIWFTEDIDVDLIEQTMRHKRMVLLRLSWQGNENLVKGEKSSLNYLIEELKPAISQWRRFIFSNEYKSRSIGWRLGLFRDIMPYQLTMYVLYAVASAVFEKDYWLYLWEGAGERVFEEWQLRKAWQWHTQRHGGVYSTYGKLQKESTETSYLTSTNNGYPASGFPEIKCNMIQVNHLFNQAWLRGELNSMEGWPKDFSVDYLMQFLSPADKYAELCQDWLEWIRKFKSDYRRLGCVVD